MKYRAYGKVKTIHNIGDRFKITVVFDVDEDGLKLDRDIILEFMVEPRFVHLFRGDQTFLLIIESDVEIPQPAVEEGAL